MCIMDGVESLEEAWRNLPTTTKLADFLSCFAFPYSWRTSICLDLGRGSALTLSFPSSSAAASTFLLAGVATVPLGAFFWAGAAAFLPAGRERSGLVCNYLLANREPWD